MSASSVRIPAAFGRRRLLAAAVAVVGLLATAPGALRPAEADEPRPIRLVTLGDSLTAGYGLNHGEGFAPRLQAALTAAGLHVHVIDAGISGDTAAMGLERLDWSVPNDADAVIVELGANDALRGQPPEQTRHDIDTIVDRLSRRGQKVLVAGMKAPRNLGPDYAAAFDAIFPDVAKAHGALLYPFFLDGVALDPSEVLADGLHPNAQGVETIVTRIMPSVRELLARVEAANH